MNEGAAAAGAAGMASDEVRDGAGPVPRAASPARGANSPGIATYARRAFEDRSGPTRARPRSPVSTVRAALLEVLARSSGRERVKAYPSWAARLASSPVRALTRSQRVSNGRLKALGWQPGVAIRRTGWPDAFGRVQPEGVVSR